MTGPIARTLSFGQRHDAFVEVLAPDLSRRLLFEPFGGRMVRASLCLGDRVFCLSRTAGGHAVIAAFALADGREIARGNVPTYAQRMTALPVNGLLAFPHYGRIAFLDADSLAVLWEVELFFLPAWRRSGLRRRLRWDRIAEGDTEARGRPDAVRAGDKIAEAPDGTVRVLALASGRHLAPGDPTGLRAAGVVDLDPKARSSTFRPLEVATCGQVAPFFAPSPDGRLALRWSPVLSVSDLLDRTEHSETYNVPLALDLWDLGAGAPLRRVEVCKVPLSIRTDGFAGDGAVAGVRAYSEWTRASHDPWRLPKETPPRPGYPHPADELDSLRPSVAAWEADGQAIWLRGDASLQRVPVEGVPGPLLFPADCLTNEDREVLAARPPGTDLRRSETRGIRMPWADLAWIEEGTVRLVSRGTGDDLRLPLAAASAGDGSRILSPEEMSLGRLPDLTATDAARFLPGVTMIAGWSEEEIERGMDVLTGRIPAILSASGGEAPDFVFVVAGEALGEAAFFAELDRRGIGAVGAIRTLVRAWVEAVRETRQAFGGPEGAGPLAWALGHLAARADHCEAELRDYTLRRDGEHEGHSRDVALRGWLERRGLRDEPA